MFNSILRAPKTRVSKTASLPAPTGGWNVRDSLANMKVHDAVILDNMFPLESDVMVRMGWSEHSTGISGQVESVMAFNSATQNTLFGAAGMVIYNVTTTTASQSLSGLTNARWQHTNFRNAAGSWLYIVNGSDNPWLFNGTAWSSASISGTTASEMIHVTSFKERLWFVKANTLEGWYLNTGAISGTATKFDISAFCKRGGYLMAVDGWTIDAGEGMDDYFAFVTSEGEVLIYQGTDPTSATTWSLKGRWQLGAPIGRRCLKKVRGDLLLICVDGVVPLSKALVSDRVDPRIAITDKIQGAMRDAAQLYGANFGWQTEFYPQGSMVIVNVPISAGSDQQQFAMNTITGSWGRFLEIEANCWEIFQDDPYFGGNGFVGKFWDTLSDNGNVINWEGQQAFSYFGSRGEKKHFKAVRPIFQSNGSPSTSAILNLDYSTDKPSATLTFSAQSYGVWDTATWDNGVWGGELSVISNWQGINGVGTAASFHLIGQTSGIDTHWLATDFLFEPCRVAI